MPVLYMKLTKPINASMYGSITVVISLAATYFFYINNNIEWMITSVAMALSFLYFSLITLLYSFFKKKIIVFLYENIIVSVVTITGLATMVLDRLFLFY